jgi:uncharacterized protein (DUF1501 family)
LQATSFVSTIDKEFSMQCNYACDSTDHLLSRRALLRASVAGGLAAGLGGFCTSAPAVAEQIRTSGKRILNIFLHGGVSQLESWDPKPNTDTGGPFRAISTSVPGMHISELLPFTAQQMHRLAIIRSLNTKNGDHGRGTVEMTTGRKQVPGTNYPHLGAVAAKGLTPDKFPLPGHVLIRGAGPGSGDAAYLGPQYASVVLNDGKPPENSARSAAVSSAADERRNQLRQRANDRFAGRRRTADTDAYTFSYDQAQQLMARADVFDVTKEPEADHDRYGRHEFGQHCLLARRLLEAEVPFVQINHSNYDTHFENFDYHIEQLGEFDRPFATLVADLADRGLLENTLVCVMSEFGRTPKINKTYGRDHWGTAWSVLMGGARIQPGAVIGKTNANGTAVEDREVDHGEIFHTILQAAGVDSKADFDIGGRLFPVADPAKDAITELLA